MKIAVIGGGIAGAAAAFELARSGARATVFHDLPGSSALYSGALDLEPWQRGAAASPVSAELAQFAAELGIWSLPDRALQVATAEGNLRPARGADHAVLDLERCAGKRVAVVDVERDDWDAPLLLKSFNDNSWARRTNTQFFAAPLHALRSGFERRIASYDFAALHDAPERAASLLAALRDSQLGAEAWLFGPWLGIERPLARELSEALGVPVGETTSAPGGSAGARFELARDRLLKRVADVRRERVVALKPAAHGYRIELRDGSAEQFSGVLVASGGVAAGGVALDRAFERRGGTGFRLSFAAPLSLELDREVLEGVSSLAGFDFAERGLAALLEVGISTGFAGSVTDQPALFAAGDAVAARPRTALLAAESGLLAAHRLLQSLL